MTPTTNEFLQAAKNHLGAAHNKSIEGDWVKAEEQSWLAQAAAAIAGAEAAQWQAQTGVRQALAAERQAAALERIAALLGSVISGKDDATERVINTYDLSPK